VAFGYGVAVWAMVKNGYFSSVARIQDDRGQVVVTSGPYRWMRHPAYAGSLVVVAAFTLMLGALWSYFPAVFYCLAIIIRTLLEDQMLRDNLDGYREYANQTAYRLNLLIR
jgi:protein-S-isoprenylcysteine O-methyltransferase Ste14